MRIIRNFIDGTWRDSAGGRVPDVNPADVTDVIAEAPSSTAAEAAEACEAAARAFEGWRSTPAPVRGQILFRIQRLMEDRRPELAKALTREEGKTLAESRGEIQRAINVVGFFAGEARRITGENGIGLREMGRVAIDFYTELKVVYVDYTGGARKTNLY